MERLALRAAKAKHRLSVSMSSCHSPSRSRQPTIYNEQSALNLDRVASAIPPTEGQSCSDG